MSIEYVDDPSPLEPLSDLDELFALPDQISDQGLRVAYEALLARFRREYRIYNLGVLQLMLLERICYAYIVMKVRDRTCDEPVVSIYQRDWLILVQEFHKQIKGSDPKALDNLKVRVVHATNTALNEIPSEQVRRKVRTVLADELEAVGL